MSVTTTKAALSEILEPLSRALDVDTARVLIGLRIDPALEARLEQLAERCNEGLLDPAERAAYESYVEGAEILALIKLKARRYLTDHGVA